VRRAEGDVNRRLKPGGGLVTEHPREELRGPGYHLKRGDVLDEKDDAPGGRLRRPLRADNGSSDDDELWEDDLAVVKGKAGERRGVRKGDTAVDAACCRR